MDKRPQRLAKNTTALMPKNASCKRWDTLLTFPYRDFSKYGG
jgi:hypothetical protein